MFTKHLWRLSSMMIGLVLVGAGCSANVAVNQPSPTRANDQEVPVEQPTATVAAPTTEPEKKEPAEENKEEPKSAETAKVETKVEAKVDSELVIPRTEAFFVEAKQWEFVPATITVTKGSNVQLVFESKDVDHGVSIPAFNIKASLAPGQRTKVEFVADKVGSFFFTCNVFCGDGHSGMKGMLIVKEK